MPRKPKQLTMADESGAPMAKSPSLYAAPDVGRIAYPILAEHHARLRDAEILYLFTDKKPVHLGKAVRGKVMKLGELPRLLSTGQDPEHPRADFVIVVRRDLWELGDLEYKEALVDDLLERCGYDDEKDAWVINPPDVELSAAVLNRRGLWNPEIREFAEACGDVFVPGALVPV